MLSGVQRDQLGAPAPALELRRRAQGLCWEKGNDVLIPAGRGEEDPKHVQRAERDCCG